MVHYLCTFFVDGTFFLYYKFLIHPAEEAAPQPDQRANREPIAGKMMEKLMKLPEFTYHVITRWPDGDLLTAEHEPTRDAAFDAAADLITNNDCKVRVEMIERNAETGGSLGVSDVTALMLTERGIDLTALNYVPCADCGHDHCTCDAAYDEWKVGKIAAE